MSFYFICMTHKSDLTYMCQYKITETMKLKDKMPDKLPVYSFDKKDGTDYTRRCVKINVLVCWLMSKDQR